MSQTLSQLEINNSTTIHHWINGQPTVDNSARRAPVFNPATGEDRDPALAGRTEQRQPVRHVDHGLTIE